jgi:hypothetical protein
VAIRGWYRHRVRVNQELRAAVLAQASRPSKQVLDVLGRQRIVFRDAGIQVTVIDRHWPEREALTYCAARLALSPDRVLALIKPIKRR